MKGIRLAYQDQERGLERILDILRIAQHLAADVENERPVTLHQCFERRFITPLHKLFQQVAIRRAGQRPLLEDSVEILNRDALASMRHQTWLPPESDLLPVLRA